MNAKDKLNKAANALIETIQKAGGGSISINGKEVVKIPANPEPIACWKCGSEDPEALAGSDYCINCIRRERQP